jgi:hypothetical protein
VAIAEQQALSGITSQSANANGNSLTLTLTNNSTTYFTPTALYIKVGTVQGSAATVDVIIFLEPLWSPHEFTARRDLAEWHHRGEWFAEPFKEIKTAMTRAFAKIPERNRLYREHFERHSRLVAEHQKESDDGLFV